MHALEAQFPPLAQALQRLGENPAPRRPANEEGPTHDLLRLMPEPALAADLPGTATARGGGMPGPEAARTYWFDL
jgi:hypothetical protein